jgi:hypothetical protein
MLCGMISFGLLFAIWLPATVLAAIGRKITDEYTEAEEPDEGEEE